VYPGQPIYSIVRPNEQSFGSLNIKMIPYFSTGYKIETINKTLDGINPGIDNPFTKLSNFNYAQVYDPSFIRLPIQSNLWSPGPTSNFGQNNLGTSNTPIGYDASGISNDLTDYMPYSLNSIVNFSPYGINVGIDPINTYQFQCNSSYDTNTQSYFYSGSSNSVLLPQLLNVYSTTTIDHRQEKISHYYSLNYLISAWDVDYYKAYISDNEYQQPFTQFTTSSNFIRGYQYSSNVSGNTSNAEYLSLGLGPCGFSFIPDDGVWDIDTVILRSAFNQSDPNSNVMYLGVYNMVDIYNLQVTDINLYESIAVLSNTSNVQYNPSNINSLSVGFDRTGGTYYQFNKMSNLQLSNTNSTIHGYSQQQSHMTNNINNLYSIIAFDSNKKPTTLKGMSGSTVPFPYYNEPKVSSVYLDGTPAPAPFFYDLIVPNGTTQNEWTLPTGGSCSDYGPTAPFDGTQSFFALSHKIGTTVVHYIDTAPFIIDVSGIYGYDLPYEPNAIVGTVKDFILTQGNTFQAWYYQEDVRHVRLAWNLTADLIYPLEF
jgi:hypothetical protein